MLLFRMCLRDREGVRPHSAAGVTEDGGSEALSDPHQAGSIDLHYQIIYLDPAHTQTHTQTQQQL